MKKDGIVFVQSGILTGNCTQLTRYQRKHVVLTAGKLNEGIIKVKDLTCHTHIKQNFNMELKYNWR